MTGNATSSRTFLGAKCASSHPHKCDSLKLEIAMYLIQSSVTYVKKHRLCNSAVFIVLFSLIVINRAGRRSGSAVDMHYWGALFHSHPDTGLSYWSVFGFPHCNYTRTFYVIRYWSARARTYVLKILCFPRILVMMINFSELKRLVAVLFLQRPGFDAWPPSVICGEPSSAEKGFSPRTLAFLLSVSFHQSSIFIHPSPTVSNLSKRERR